MSLRLLPLIMLLSVLCLSAKAQTDKNTGNPQLEALFIKWRSFENPPRYQGAPDYRKATFAARRPNFEALQQELLAIDTSGWNIADKADWMIVWAEMNGYDFNERVLKPWERDPAFYKSLWTYKSDVPAHEGPTHHGTTELWTYTFPLSKAAQKQLLTELALIPELHIQARENLTGNARDLWVTGIRDLRFQSDELAEIKKMAGVAADKKLLKAIDEAIASTDSFASWLEAEALSKDGPSGLGKAQYTWYQQNVHLVPLTWEDEVMILKHELARAWASLKLEEHRNRNLPAPDPVNSPAAYDSLADAAASSLMNFLREQGIATVKDYWEPALREHLGSFVPADRRNFFWITAHHDPRPLFSHFYHWFELARMEKEPNGRLVRRGPLLYNIFDSRNEGMATAVEEYFMQAGLYDDAPRAREIVYIMIAQRAARGLGSLYAHANEMTMTEAGGIHSDYTPRGWMKTEKELLIFEQHLYLRQPGYGTSYITGKYLLTQTMADYARILESRGETFRLSDFFDQLNATGNIPVSLGHWQLTGEPGLIEKIMKKP